MKKKKSYGTYTCAICNGTFEKGRSDAEAEAEFKLEFPTISITETSIICDPCYEIITKDIEENPWKYPKIP